MDLAELLNDAWIEMKIKTYGDGERSIKAFWKGTVLDKVGRFSFLWDFLSLFLSLIV